MEKQRFISLNVPLFLGVYFLKKSQHTISWATGSNGFFLLHTFQKKNIYENISPLEIQIAV